MTLKEFIKQLSECLEQNGDLYVAVCADGTVYPVVELNAADDTVYVEGYILY